MRGSVVRAARRPLATLAGGALVASAMLGTGTAAGAAEETGPHWGNYQWAGGQEKANVRAFWLFDRTGDPTMNAIIKVVTDGWNEARGEHPELPYIAVYRDDANAGKCFVNKTAGYSVASACMMRSLSAFGIKGISATHGTPHFLGGAFAVSDGLSFEDAFTAVCHNFGHVMGLADSDDENSCMNHDVEPGKVMWYGPGDGQAIVDLYGHDDGKPPVGNADIYTTNEDVPLVVGIPGVLANDTDPEGDALTAVKVTDPAKGTVALNANGSFTYTPNADFTGTDTFTYKASGGGSESAPATVTITVRPVPDAVNDAYETNEDTVLNVTTPGVLSNDVHTEGGLTAVKMSDPEHGEVTLNGDGSFSYTPDTNFSGSDTFTYKASAGATESAVKTVTITVKAVNDAPVAVNDTYATTTAVPLTRGPDTGVLDNDTDVDSTTLTATDASDPEHGTVIVGADGSFTYTPDLGFSGIDSFTYKASDGTAKSAAATVTITVSAPVAS
ncbi:MAG: cadherin-like domain-containing protein [Actinomycetota bacterium]|nr:cadherin-like domain-containing protein [Actinomycetota bacterium]